MTWEKSDIDKYYADHPDLKRGSNQPVSPAKPSSVKSQAQNKWHVAPKEERIYNGKLYASKKEALKAQELDLRVKAGDIDFYLEQVPFKLPGGAKHRLDFVTFKQVEKIPLYEVHFIEVKGRDLELGKLKRHQTEELFGISVELV